MVNQEVKNALTISAVQPDLNFPEYKAGKFRNYSQAVELKITLLGKWTTASQDYIKNIDNSGANTIITLECIDGLPREFKMTKL